MEKGPQDRRRRKRVKKLEGSGGTPPENFLWQHPLDWLKMVLEISLVTQMGYLQTAFDTAILYKVIFVDSSQNIV